MNRGKRERKEVGEKVFPSGPGSLCLSSSSSGLFLFFEYFIFIFLLLFASEDTEQLSRVMIEGIFGGGIIKKSISWLNFFGYLGSILLFFFGRFLVDIIENKCKFFLGFFEYFFVVEKGLLLWRFQRIFRVISFCIKPLAILNRKKNKNI